jgi:hypothetical protein
MEGGAGVERFKLHFHLYCSGWVSSFSELGALARGRQAV